MWFCGQTQEPLQFNDLTAEVEVGGGQEDGEVEVAFTADAELDENQPDADVPDEVEESNSDRNSPVKSNNVSKKKKNVNRKKKLGKLIPDCKKSDDDDSDDEQRTNNVITKRIKGKENCVKEEAVKLSTSPVKNKENYNEQEKIIDKDNSNNNKPSCEKENICKVKDWNTEDKRKRRSSECIIGVSSNADARKLLGKEPATLSLSCGSRPRSILKRRGRSFSESHIGSLEECLGTELLGKYGTVEHALVEEYGCLEGLLEECGWEEDGEDCAFGRSDEIVSSVGSKKSVRFNDVQQTHLFMSKASILNQLANDDKKAMRHKMKENKKRLRQEKRLAHRSGSLSSSPRTSFDSSYRSNNGYSSVDEDLTTEESDGTELLTSSSGDTTEEETDDSSCGDKPPSKHIMEPSVVLSSKKNQQKFSGRKRGRKNNKKRPELSNTMIFQLDMDS